MDSTTPPRGRAVLPAGRAPRERTLLDVLASTVREHPDAPAIDDGIEVRDYARLARDVDALRSRLRAAGIGVGDRVGVRVPAGSAEVYVAILAVLAAGAAYVPVEADDPEARAATVWARAGVCAVLGARQVLTLLPDVLPRSASGDPSPDDDAWIIFTSGTTDRPKAVACRHRSAAALVDAEAGLFLPDAPLGPGDRVLGGLSVAFDASCEEMWLAWRHGACLVPAPRALVRGGVDLCPWLVERRISVISTVPTLAALWPPEALRDVRLLILGGEAFSQATAARWLGEGREVWNTYGPTETTVVASAAPVRAGEAPRIGLPIAGWGLAVVDEEGEPVAWGEAGELVVGGVGVARYLDPVLDAERFAPLPGVGWSRGYRSGDLVLADPDGLVFLGRRDDQIKIRGHRIEPAELREALESHPGVLRAHARAVGGDDGTRLVAYVVMPGVTVPELRRHLAATVPAAMRPDHVVSLDAMPTTVSGKIDVHALPDPAPRVTAPASAPEPSRDVEDLVAGIWCDVLDVDDVDRDTGFLEVGGNSLLLARVRDRLAAALERPVAVVELFAHPTVRALSAHLQRPTPRPQTHRPSTAVGEEPPAMSVSARASR